MSLFRREVRHYIVSFKLTKKGDKLLRKEVIKHLIDGNKGLYTIVNKNTLVKDYIHTYGCFSTSKRKASKEVLKDAPIKPKYLEVTDVKDYFQS